MVIHGVSIIFHDCDTVFHYRYTKCYPLIVSIFCSPNPIIFSCNEAEFSHFRSPYTVSLTFYFYDPKVHVIQGEKLLDQDIIILPLIVSWAKRTKEILSLVFKEKVKELLSSKSCLICASCLGHRFRVPLTSSS